jgi:hypothetical protein
MGVEKEQNSEVETRTGTQCSQQAVKAWYKPRGALRLGWPGGGAPYAWNSIDAARIGIDRSPGAPERNVPAFRSHLFHLVSLRLY